MADLIERSELRKDFCNMCEAMQPEMIDEQPAVSRWIPCSEMLPEIDEDVMVYYPYWKDTPIQVAHLQYDGMYYETSDGEFNLPVQAVTHWMPLPEPPEKE